MRRRWWDRQPDHGEWMLGVMLGVAASLWIIIAIAP